MGATLVPSTKSMTVTETETTSDTVGNITTTTTVTTTVTTTTTVGPATEEFATLTAPATATAAAPAATASPATTAEVSVEGTSMSSSDDADMASAMRMMTMMTEAAKVTGGEAADDGPEDKYANMEEEIEALGGEAWFFDDEDEPAASAAAAEKNKGETAAAAAPPTAWPTHTPTSQAAPSPAPVEVGERPTTRVRVEDLAGGLVDATRGMREGDPARFMDPEDEIIEQGGDPWFLSEDEVQG
jgi:hypothetical protein